MKLNCLYYNTTLTLIQLIKLYYKEDGELKWDGSSLFSFNNRKSKK